MTLVITQKMMIASKSRFSFLSFHRYVNIGIQLFFFLMFCLYLLYKINAKKQTIAQFFLNSSRELKLTKKSLPMFNML